MRRERMGRLPGGTGPLPSSLLLGSRLSLPPDLACQRQPLFREPLARYPAAPLPPLLGWQSGSGWPRILPPWPTSGASHHLARDPRGEGRRLEGLVSSVHSRWGGCLSDHDASPGTLLQTLQRRVPALATSRDAEGVEKRQGRAGEQCGRLATVARPGKRLCAKTRDARRRGLRPPPHSAGSGRFEAGSCLPGRLLRWRRAEGRGRRLGERGARPIGGLRKEHLVPISSSESAVP